MQRAALRKNSPGPLKSAIMPPYNSCAPFIAVFYFPGPFLTMQLS